MRILVTGGAGFIGAHFVHAACEAGHQVVVLDDLSAGEPLPLPPAARIRYQSSASPLDL